MDNPKYVSARDGEKNSVIYVTADGREYLHSGGTRAWRNNNPGNLSKAEKSGLAIGVGGPFAVFPDHEAGKAALKFVLTHVYDDKRLDKVFEKYAPAKDNNDPEHYTMLVKKFTGLDASRTVGDLNAAELDKFMGAIERVEGWKAGKVEPIPHAQQFEVKGVDGKPLSGVDYIMSFFTSKGEEKKIKGKTDEKGKTDVAVTDKRTSVSLNLPRPDPGQSLKGTGTGGKGKTDAAKHVEAASVKSKPWYAFVFGNADECLTEAKKKNESAEKDKEKHSKGKAADTGTAPKEKEKKQEKAPPPAAPVATVQQKGAIKASATADKAENKVSQVTKEPGVFITWQFDTTHGSGKNLRGLPYFIAIMDGNKATPLYEGQRVQLLGDPNKIRQKIPFGKQAALFLGSDAKAKYRTKPLFQVTADAGLTDVVVKINETEGKDYDAGLEVPALKDENGTKKVYQAALYGNTWLNFSHKYTADEAAEMTKEASSDVQKAVISIYKGEPQAADNKITLEVRKPNGTMMKIIWPSDAFDNCKRNVTLITNMESAKREAMPRVHPNTYQAFMQAAFEMDAQELEVNSGWRPMLGSVLHRIGVGLDVGRIRVAGSDRQYRRSATTAESHYSALKKEKATLSAKKNRTEAEEQRLNAIKVEEPDAAKKALDAISANEHSDLKTFTSKLRGNTEVRQTFDPWQMEDNTADKAAPAPNMLKTGNEVLHRNHLHITVFDEELGHGR
ncbi:hypothetical protein [Pseudoduganella violaceinigra]|uniref:hypothetical protein n=1 Tax=Pseudoduganella violaceinigra TaxID=246602 RepID=UPI0004079F14|nr:hypothetical protein [Pseudoduganella violaceinigra]